MVQFNELRVSKDGEILIIDASIRDLPYYKDVYIKNIIVDTQDTYISSGPSKNAIYTKEWPENQNNKKVRVELPIETSFKDNLFFVYIKTKGIPTADTPCGLDNNIILGITFWEMPLYDVFMNNIKSLEETCEVPKNFIDVLLKFKAFEVAVNTEHYNQAIKYYNKFIKSINSNSTTINNKLCNCHG